MIYQEEMMCQIKSYNATGIVVEAGEMLQT